MDIWSLAFCYTTIHPFPNPSPSYSPGCCQLCQNDFCNDGFTWHGTLPPPATEKVAAPLREAQYLLELFLTLMVLQKGFKNKILKHSLKAKVEKYIKTHEMPPISLGFFFNSSNLGQLLSWTWGIFELQAADSTPTKARKQIPARTEDKSARKSRYYSLSLAYVWSKLFEFECVSRENN